MKSFFFGCDRTLRNGWKALAFVALAAVFVIAFQSLARWLMPEAKVLGNVVPAVGILIASLICVRLEGATLASIGLKWDGRFLLHFSTGLAAGIGLICLTGLGVWMFDGFHLVRNADADPMLFLKVGVTMLAVALMEEQLFRGYGFQRAVRGLGRRGAVLLFAMVFTAAHGAVWSMHGLAMMMAALNIFLAAVMLSYCYLRTASLALPIGVHMGWNWMQDILGFGVSGSTSKGWWSPVLHRQQDWLTGGSFGLEASAPGVVVIGLVVLALIRWKGSDMLARNQALGHA
jgi:membrane protease YdiL (CAAX protease family)